jgi:hypothetical protein
MKANAAKLALALAVLVLLLMGSAPLQAQAASATLSGVVTGPSGEAVPNAQVVVTNAATGQATPSSTDATGHYTVTNLNAGSYQVSISATGFVTTVQKATLTAGAPQSLNMSLMTAQAAQAPGSKPAAPPATNLPNAPSTSKSQQLSLQDLGFSPEQTEANAKLQALLNKRTHMLKIHQTLGLITIAPMLATLIASVNAGGRTTSSTDRNVHMILGAVTGDLYFTTAYFAIRAPKVPGTETRGHIKWHKRLAWIHGPGMVLTPILGAMAYEQKSNGQKVHGIAQAHGPVAIVTAGAFGAAVLAVASKF